MPFTKTWKIQINVFSRYECVTNTYRFYKRMTSAQSSYGVDDCFNHRPKRSKAFQEFFSAQSCTGVHSQTHFTNLFVDFLHKFHNEVHQLVLVHGFHVRVCDQEANVIILEKKESFGSVSTVSKWGRRSAIKYDIRRVFTVLKKMMKNQRLLEGFRRQNLVLHNHVEHAMINSILGLHFTVYQGILKI